MKRIIGPVLIVSILFVSCIKNNVNNGSSCSYDPCALKAPAVEVTQVETYLSGAGIATAIKHCSGMYYEITDPGTGTPVTVCSYVSVNYKGTLTDGTVFDSTAAGTPATIGLPGVIAGWQNGIPLLKKGGIIRLFIPPTLGYGPNDVADPVTKKVVIPANSVLVFKVEVVDVQ